MTETTVDAHCTEKSPRRHVSTHGLHLTFITLEDGLAAPRPYLVLRCVYTRGCGGEAKAAWLSLRGARWPRSAVTKLESQLSERLWLTADYWLTLPWCSDLASFVALQVLVLRLRREHKSTVSKHTPWCVRVPEERVFYWPFLSLVLDMEGKCWRTCWYGFIVCLSVYLPLQFTAILQNKIYK